MRKQRPAPYGLGRTALIVSCAVGGLALAFAAAAQQGPPVPAHKPSLPSEGAAGPPRESEPAAPPERGSAVPRFDGRGTRETPLAVEVTNLPKPEPRPPVDTADREARALFERLVPWLLAGVAATGLLQILVLTVQAFWLFRLIGSVRRTAAVTENALGRLERPYVFVEVTDSGLELSAAADATRARGLFEFACVNHGRTPAYLTAMRDDMVIMRKGEAPPPLSSIEAARDLPVGVVAGAGRACTFVKNLRGRGDLDDWLDIGAQGGDLYFLGYLRYSDIFGKRYITGFCMMFEPVGNRFVLRGDGKFNYTRTDDSGLF